MRGRLVIEAGDRDTKVRGYGAADLLREAGTRPYFAGGAWWIATKHLPDVVAYLDYRNIRYRLENTAGA